MRGPRFIADQARHAKGPLGRLIAFVMARETAEPNRRAINELEVAETDHVLDIGCGPGTALSELATRTPEGHASGIDPSPLMVRLAQRRNGALIDQGRVTVARADISALPFPDSTFDKALCVHVIYFWDDLDHGFREIARVLKPGGRLALLFRSSDDQRSTASFPASVYRFRTVAEIEQALVTAGFVVKPQSPADKSLPQVLVASLA